MCIKDTEVMTPSVVPVSADGGNNSSSSVISGSTIYHFPPYDSSFGENQGIKLLSRGCRYYQRAGQQGQEPLGLLAIRVCCIQCQWNSVGDMYILSQTKHAACHMCRTQSVQDEIEESGPSSYTQTAALSSELLSSGTSTAYPLPGPGDVVTVASLSTARAAKLTRLFRKTILSVDWPLYRKLCVCLPAAARSDACNLGHAGRWRIVYYLLPRTSSVDERRRRIGRITPCEKAREFGRDIVS